VAFEIPLLTKYLAIAGVAARTSPVAAMNNSGNAIGISPNLPFNFM
jgi:hypothetical protein